MNWRLKTHILWEIQEYYRQYPEDVLSLILLDGGYFFLGDVEPHTQINLPKTDDFEALKNSAKELVKNSPADDKEQYEKYTLHTFIKEGDYYIHHSDETALNALSLEVSTIDYRINNSEIPIFLLIASDGFYSSSPELFGKYIEDFKETNTKTEVYIIENGQHFLPITNTGQVADILLEALN